MQRYEQIFIIHQVYRHIDNSSRFNPKIWENTSLRSCAVTTVVHNIGLAVISGSL